jgi:hypothetical protein
VLMVMVGDMCKLEEDSVQPDSNRIHYALYSAFASFSSPWHGCFRWWSDVFLIQRSVATREAKAKEVSKTGEASLGRCNRLHFELSTFFASPTCTPLPSCKGRPNCHTHIPKLRGLSSALL